VVENGTTAVKEEPRGCRCYDLEFENSEVKKGAAALEEFRHQVLAQGRPQLGSEFWGTAPNTETHQTQTPTN
jgi:hypothetical protein